MKWNDITSTAWSNLGRRKVRTALTSMGVVVGILTIVTLISLANGVQYQVTKQFEAVGLDRVRVMPPGGFGAAFSGGGGGGGDDDLFGLNARSRIITPTDVQRWQKWREVKSVTPEINLPFGVVTGLKLDDKLHPVRIAGGAGMLEGLFSGGPEALAGTVDLPEGRGSLVVSRGALRRFDVGKDACNSVVGKSAQVILKAPRGEQQSFSVKIIGVSDEGGNTVHVSSADELAMKGWWLNEPDPLKSEGYDAVSVKVKDIKDLRDVVHKLRTDGKPGQGKLSIIAIDAILNIVNKIVSVITMMVALISGVTLFVASIGIANTMIMAIYERTREIGTLKAMGASRSDIRSIFMLEAGFIGLIGGVVGLVLSWGLGAFLNVIIAFIAKRGSMPAPDHLFLLTPGLAIEALVFAFLIGMVAGLYPAARAARLDPLTALRHV